MTIPVEFDRLGKSQISLASRLIYSGNELTPSLTRSTDHNMDTPKNQYELGYHLLPELDEKELPGKVAEIEQILTDNGGTVLKSQEPKKKHLSYPIKLKHYAHFGVMEFEAPAESIEKINTQLKMQNDILRYLLIHGYGPGKVLRSLTPSKRRARPMKPELGAQAGRAPTKEEPAVKPEEMEKQLEDVIEKI